MRRFRIGIQLLGAFAGLAGLTVWSTLVYLPRKSLRSGMRRLGLMRAEIG
ncbi:hypothetical protein OCOJLMKI_4004 [Methylobacterium iners]|uniref:Uncharacterized protein n=1 Tax=Methylobacterium iners TaxID=418707 RepID=A0ABQ4S4F9_9HYPH|nr:hypothetical protein OCOJLMKI_4004 [Methylobacterium iners]